MTNNLTINSILANGGWCQLQYSNNVALIDVIGGRLLFYNEELSLIERFDLRMETLDGYFVILNETRQRLKKASWIKRILTIGGKTIGDSTLPATLHAESLHDLLYKLKSSREIYIVRFTGGEVTGRTLDFSDSALTLDTISADNASEKVSIDFSDILCLEFKIQKLNHTVKRERKWAKESGKDK